MIKSQLKQHLIIKNQSKQQPKQQSEKACFGTKEWSENSGICNRCECKDECGKIKKSKSL